MRKRVHGELEREDYIRRSDSVAAFAVGGGMITCPVEIVLADGSHFVLEVQRAQKGKAEKVGALFAH